MVSEQELKQGAIVHGPTALPEMHVMRGFGKKSLRINGVHATLLISMNIIGSNGLNVPGRKSHMSPGWFYTGRMASV